MRIAIVNPRTQFPCVCLCSPLWAQLKIPFIEFEAFLRAENSEVVFKSLEIEIGLAHLSFHVRGMWLAQDIFQILILAGNSTTESAFSLAIPEELDARILFDSAPDFFKEIEPYLFQILAVNLTERSGFPRKENFRMWAH